MKVYGDHRCVVVAFCLRLQYGWQGSAKEMGSKWRGRVNKETPDSNTISKVEMRDCGYAGV